MEFDILGIIIKRSLLKNYISLVLLISGCLCLYFFKYYMLSIILTSSSIILAAFVFFYIIFLLEWSDESIKTIFLKKKYLVKAFQSSLIRYLYYVIIKGDSSGKENMVMDGAFTLTRKIILSYFVSCWVGSVIAFAIIFQNFSYIWDNSFFSTFKKENVTEFIDLLYFSFATITTLGSSEIIPIGSYYVKFFCVSEAILGLFLTGLGISYLLFGFHRIKLVASGIIDSSYKYYQRNPGDKQLLCQKIIDYYEAPYSEKKKKKEDLAYELSNYKEYLKENLPDYGILALIKKLFVIY
jgi:hypothetical protein